MEIASLHTQLNNQLITQSEMTDRLYGNALDTQQSIIQGNEQLQKAKKRQSIFTKWISIMLVFLSTILLLLDIYYS